MAPRPTHAAVAPETLRPVLWLISTLGRAATAVTTKKRRKFRDNSVKLRLSTCPTRNSPGAPGAAAYAFAMAPRWTWRSRFGSAAIPLPHDHASVDLNRQDRERASVCGGRAKAGIGRWSPDLSGVLTVSRCAYV